MKTRRTHVYAVLVLLLVSACASMPVKQKAVLSLQSVQVALGAAQDLERAAYQQQTIPGLTADRHKVISQAFVVAFDTQIKTAMVLQAWKAGDPVPTSLSQLHAAATDVLTLVSQLVTNASQKDLVARAQEALDHIAAVVALLQGGGA